MQKGNCKRGPALDLVFGLLLIGGCLTTGCTITTKNQGEVGFRYGHEIVFFHRAAQTAPEPATIKTEVPAIEEYFKKDEADMPPETPTPNP